MAKPTKLPKIKKEVKTKRNYIKELDTLWSLAVRGRDKCCQICHGTSNLQAHHIITRKRFATRWDTDNGITLCYMHHIEGVHKDTVNYALKIIEWLGGRQVFEKLHFKSSGIVKMTALSYEDKKNELKKKIESTTEYNW
jgi:hypothetical protein